jgi:hypothetical protein
MEGTIFYGLRLKDKSEMPDITEHLAMNGYTYDTNADDTLFVYSEEVDYVETILKDHGVEYEII